MSEEKNKTIVGEVGSVTITEPVKSVGVLTLELNEIKTDISAETDKMLSKETSGSNLLLIFPRRARWRGEEGIVGGDRLDHATNFCCFENPPPGGEGSFCFSSESAFERKAERCLIN